MKPLTLSRTFPYLLNFSSISSNLVKCLALPYFSISLIKISLLRAHFNILKLHLIAPKHIPISFSISLAIPHFLESNITHDIIQKYSSNSYNLLYLLHLTFILSISHFPIFTNAFLTKYPYILLIYLQTPYYYKIHTYIYFLPSPLILKHIKHSSKNTLQKPFSWKAISLTFD